MAFNKYRINFSPNIPALLLLLIGTLWFSYEMLWEAKVPFFRDLGPYFYPIRFSLAESFRIGELPLWDRHMAMGFPLLADFQSGSFYPPHLLFLWVSFFDAVRALFFFHYLVAAAGSYCLARHWGYSVYLSLIGAILFTFGGVLVSLTNVLNHFQTAVWLPWLILAGERSFRSGSGKDFLTLTAVALVQFLAGSPEFYVMSMALLMLDGIGDVREASPISYTKPCLLILGANVLVIGLSMIQVLPTLELFSQSRRQTHVSDIEAMAWSLHPLSLLNLFFLDKEVDTALFSGFRLFHSRDLPFIISLYLGQVCLLGLCSWASYSRRKEKAVLLSLLLAGTVLALGKYTPVYSYLLAYLPFFGSFRFPEKFLFLVYPLLLFMTLRGLNELVENRKETRQTPLLIVFAILVSLTLVYLACRFWPQSFLAFSHWTGLAPDLSGVKLLAAFWLSLERQILLLGGTFLVVFLYRRDKINAHVVRALIVGLVFTDLAVAHRPYQFLIHPEVATGKARILSSVEAERYRLFSSLPNLHPAAYTLRDRPFEEVTRATWSALVPNVGLFYGVDYMQEIDALGRAPYDHFLATAKNFPPEKFYPLLGALNVKYVSSFSRLPDGEVALVRDFPDYPLWVYRLNRTTPRAYIAAAARQERDPAKILHELGTKGFDPFAEVLLDEALSLSAKKSLRAEAKIIEYKNQSVTINTWLDGAGVLVLADSFYPGWNVYVNGKRDKVLRANFFFRAVALPAGNHTVVFRYEPRSFAIGRMISLGTFALVVGSSMLVYFRKRLQSARMDAV